MKKALLIAIAWLSVAVAVPAQELGWRDKDGRHVPDSPSQKSKDNFGGMLLITDDADWEAKWNTPPEVTPHFHETDTVKVGETVVVLIFVTNPSKDADGNINVTCDLQMTRPDGTLSIDKSGVACMVGPLPGDPMNVYLADPVVGFLGELSDPVGKWVFRVRLKDVVRDITLELETSFTYLNDG